MIETQQTLDKLKCSNPECDHSSHASGLYVHSGCHPEFPTWARYENGVLYIECAACRKEIVKIAVDPGTIERQ